MTTTLFPESGDEYIRVSKRTCELTSSIVPQGHHSTVRPCSAQASRDALNCNYRRRPRTCLRVRGDCPSIVFFLARQHIALKQQFHEGALGARYLDDERLHRWPITFLTSSDLPATRLTSARIKRSHFRKLVRSSANASWLRLP